MPKPKATITIKMTREEAVHVARILGATTETTAKKLFNRYEASFAPTPYKVSFNNNDVYNVYDRLDDLITA